MDIDEKGDFMKNIIKFIISPIIFLVFYILAEYLISGAVNLKMAFFSIIIYAVLNAIFHILLDKRFSIK